MGCWAGFSVLRNGLMPGCGGKSLCVLVGGGSLFHRITSSLSSMNVECRSLTILLLCVVILK